MSTEPNIPEPPESDHLDAERLEGEELRKRNAKLDLENQKLALELRALARQTSKSGLALEWLKSATGLVALIGIAVTLYIGFGQVRQSEQNRLGDRFDKALIRLASDKPNERMTGVSGLRLFLTEADTSLRSSALHFLVNAVSVETDPLVQTSILDVFSELKPIQIGEVALNEALRTALERNRSLAKGIREQWRDSVTRDQMERIAQYSPLKLKLDQKLKSDQIPLSLIAKLPLKEYLNFLEAERGPFDDLDPKQNVALRGLVRLIPKLVALGAKGSDFSGIFCPNCDFTTANLSGAKFDDAFLWGANFSHALLQNASFQNAALGGTIFFSANLSHANLRTNASSWEDFPGVNAIFPLFDCANLRGTDLSGTPLLVYHTRYRANEFPIEVSAPLMRSAQVDSSTKLENFVIASLTDISDSYLANHPEPYFFSSEGRYSIVGSPILRDSFPKAQYRRYKGYFSLNEAEYTSTMLILYISIDVKNLSLIKSEVKSNLRGYLDQPSLNIIALLSAFENALKDSSEEPASHHWPEKSSYTCGEKIPKGEDLSEKLQFTGQGQLK